MEKAKYNLPKGTLISLFGIPGSGKSFIGQGIAKLFGMSYICEKVVHHKKEPYKINSQVEELKLFVSDYKAQLKACREGKSNVLDLSIYYYPAMVKGFYNLGLIKKEEYELSIKNMKDALKKITPPSLILYIECDPLVAEKRKENKNDDKELKEMNNQFLKCISKLFEEEINEISQQINVIKINNSEFAKIDDIAIFIYKNFGKFKGILTMQ